MNDENHDTNNTQNQNIPINSSNNLNEQEKFTFTDDTNEKEADVVNSPVEITSSDQISDKEEISEGSSIFLLKLKKICSPITNPFLKTGFYFQNLLSKLSEKIQVKQSYKYFLIFLALGLLFLFISLLTIPFAIFNPGKLLGLLCFGNIFIMLCFLFYYGSTDFFKFLIDRKRTGVMFGHLLSLFTSIFVSLFIGGYFLRLFLDIVLSITTIMFILTLMPCGDQGISGIKRMLISPLLLLFSTFKGKIFGSINSGEGQ